MTSFSQNNLRACKQQNKLMEKSLRNNSIVLILFTVFRTISWEKFICKPVVLCKITHLSRWNAFFQLFFLSSRSQFILKKSYTRIRIYRYWSSDWWIQSTKDSVTVTGCKTIWMKEQKPVSNCFLSISKAGGKLIAQWTEFYGLVTNCGTYITRWAN